MWVIKIKIEACEILEIVTNRGRDVAIKKTDTVLEVS